MKRKLPASTEPPKAGPAKIGPDKPDHPGKPDSSRTEPAKAELARVVAPEIIEGAKRSLETDRIKTVVKCSVCGAEATPNPAEQLCWVCRRLKISAWRDVEQQMPAQE